jgi:predicted CopG family antitoxin
MISKHIRISEENYMSLKKLGEAGDSFNDVITEMLKKIE